MSEKVKRMTFYGIFGAYFVFSICMLISISTIGSDLNELGKIIDEFNAGMFMYQEEIEALLAIYNTTKTTWIFQIIGTAILSLISLAGLFFTFKDFKNERLLFVFNLSAFVLALIFIFSYVHPLVANRNLYVLEDKGICTLVFSCFVLVGSFALFFIKTKYNSLRAMLTILTNFLLFVAICIELSAFKRPELNNVFDELYRNMYDKNASYLAFTFFTIFELFLSPILLLIGTKEVSKKSLLNKENDIRNSSNYLNNESIEEKLTKLKELYDKGIITEEEYKTKRQKYVDLL